MKKEKAIKLAIAALEYRKKQIAVDANLCFILGADYPAAENAHKEKEEILQAIDVLKGMLEC